MIASSCLHSSYQSHKKRGVFVVWAQHCHVARFMSTHRGRLRLVLSRSQQGCQPDKQLLMRIAIAQQYRHPSGVTDDYSTSLEEFQAYPIYLTTSLVQCRINTTCEYSPVAHRQCWTLASETGSATIYGSWSDR